MRAKILAIPMIVLALALSGCGTGNEVADNSDVEVTEQPVEQEVTLPGENEYATVEDLKDALVEAGFPCPAWNQTDVVTLAASSGSCSDSTVLSVYLSDDAKEEVIQNLKALKTSGGHLVVGKNWILNVPQAEIWADTLGGMPVTW